MIYFIGNGLRQVKIGYSINPLARLRDLQIASPHRLEILAVSPYTDRNDEKIYHEKYAHCKIGGEWFQINNSLSEEIQTLRKKYGVDNIIAISTKIYKNFLFNTERDQDLLIWLEAQGNQSKTVRDALYKYMRQDNPEEVTLVDLSNKIDSLSSQLSNLKFISNRESHERQSPQKHSI